MNYYEVLKCRPDATLEEIKRNYKLLALKFHPDKQKFTTEQFLIIQEAWNVLSDKHKRQQFDVEFELRNSRPLLFGTFRVSELTSDCSGNLICVCRCGGQYFLNEDDVRLVQEFRTLHVPCENCSLAARIVP